MIGSSPSSNSARTGPQALFVRQARRSKERGVAFVEFLAVMPLLVVVMLAAFDIGRIIIARQVIVDLAREAANLVSRGATTQEAFAATFQADDPLDVQSNGEIIISTVRRRDSDDETPWIFDQQRAGSMATFESKVGIVNGPAAIPNMTEVEPGVTVMAVEIVHSFQPAFGIGALGLTFYPDTLYDAAYF